MSSATIRIDQSASLQPDARPPSGTPSRPSSGKPRWCSAVGARSMIRLVVVTTLPAENPLPTAINVGCVSYGPSPPCIPQSRRTASSFSAKRTAIAVSPGMPCTLSRQLGLDRSLHSFQDREEPRNGVPCDPAPSRPAPQRRTDAVDLIEQPLRMPFHCTFSSAEQKTFSACFREVRAPANDSGSRSRRSYDRRTRHQTPLPNSCTSLRLRAWRAHE